VKIPYPMHASAPLEGKRAFIVGGSGGIGFEVSLSLGKKGAALDIHGLSSGKVSKALSIFRSEGITAEGSFGPIEVVEDFLVQRARKADILVCSFGPFLQKPLENTTSEEWARIVSLNLSLPGALASAALSGMQEKGWGRIVFFGGTRTDSIRGFRTNAAYAAAKTGLGSLTKSIAGFYAQSGIAALTICPGFVDTEYLSEKTRSELKAKTPRGNLISKSFLGSYIAQLVSEESTIWNGSIITADEGL
jgi:NAD(P)-dependent dehydrogenase (short-subunit alcohol dehydrogenase family)